MARLQSRLNPDVRPKACSGGFRGGNRQPCLGYRPATDCARLTAVCHGRCCFQLSQSAGELCSPKTFPESKPESNETCLRLVQISCPHVVEVEVRCSARLQLPGCSAVFDDSKIMMWHQSTLGQCCSLQCKVSDPQATFCVAPPSAGLLHLSLQGLAAKGPPDWLSEQVMGWLRDHSTRPCAPQQL